jgi:hypothetical protein
MGAADALEFATTGIENNRSFETGSAAMNLSISHLQPIVAIAAGILILIMPRLLNYIVAIYLILFGLLGLGILR